MDDPDPNWSISKQQRTLRDQAKRPRLTAFERDLGAWECCGFVSVPELNNCPACGAPKEKR